MQRIQCDYSFHSDDPYGFLKCLLASMAKDFQKRHTAYEYFNQELKTATDLFRFSTYSSMECSSCQRKTILTHDFHDLQLNLNSAPETIADKLTHHFPPKLIIQCEKCKARNVPTNQNVVLTKPPTVLWIWGDADGNEVDIKTQFSQDIKIDTIDYRLVSIVIQSKKGDGNFSYVGDAVLGCLDSDRLLDLDRFNVSKYILLYERKNNAAVSVDDSNVVSTDNSTEVGMDTYDLINTSSLPDDSISDSSSLSNSVSNDTLINRPVSPLSTSQTDVSCSTEFEDVSMSHASTISCYNDVERSRNDCIVTTLWLNIKKKGEKLKRTCNLNGKRKWKRMGKSKRMRKYRRREEVLKVSIFF